MKKTTVRGLRYHFPEIEAWLNKGEEIVVHKRQKVIARLLPIRPKAAAYPDCYAQRRPDLRREEGSQSRYRSCL